MIFVSRRYIPPSLPDWPSCTVLSTCPSAFLFRPPSPSTHTSPPTLTAVPLLLSATHLHSTSGFSASFKVAVLQPLTAACVCRGERELVLPRQKERRNRYIRWTFLCKNSGLLYSYTTLCLACLPADVRYLDRGPTSVRSRWGSSSLLQFLP